MCLGGSLDKIVELNNHAVAKSTNGQPGCVQRFGSEEKEQSQGAVGAIELGGLLSHCQEVTIPLVTQ